jgi:hypothetical protein
MDNISLKQTWPLPEDDCKCQETRVDFTKKWQSLIEARNLVRLLPLGARENEGRPIRCVRKFKIQQKKNVENSNEDFNDSASFWTRVL